MRGPQLTAEFSGEIWQWRGPAPYYYVTVPQAESDEIHAIAALATYGWGMIPVVVRIGDTEWPTALFAKDGLYVVPVKAWVRAAEQIDDGDVVGVRLTVVPRGPG